MSGRLRTGGHRLRIPSHLLCEVPLRAGAWSEAGSSSDQPTTARGWPQGRTQPKGSPEVHRGGVQHGLWMAFTAVVPADRQGTPDQ